jgi:dienelactone hydrolase
MSSAVITHGHQSGAGEVVIGTLQLPGDLTLPGNTSALVVFAHGSGSSRQSPRNRAVARALNEQGMATLLFDLLNADEEQDRANVFDIGLLAARLVAAVQWIDGQPELARLALGLFGASTGAAAALVAAAELGSRIGAVVSRGGRPDLAAAALDRVVAPTLLIVGGLDDVVIELNEQAFARLRVKKALTIVPGATHLFPEPGALERVIELAAGWFRAHLIPPRRQTLR